MSYYGVGHSVEVIARESYGQPIEGANFPTVRPFPVGGISPTKKLSQAMTKAFTPLIVAGQMRKIAPEAMDWDEIVGTAGKVANTLMEYGPQAWDAVKKYGPVAVSLAKKYGPQAVALFQEYGPVAAEYLQKYGPQAAQLLAAARGEGRIEEAAPAPKSFFEKNKMLILGGGAAAILLVILLKMKKRGS